MDKNMKNDTEQPVKITYDSAFRTLLFTCPQLIVPVINEVFGTDYPMCRKTPCFSYGDIRHVHRIYASN